MDRQSIERKDFPVGSRGYDPAAVDEHLAAVADQVAEYKQVARRRADTLAATASDQVRAIVEAAERSAAEIQRQAEAQAQEIREEASSEAGTIRGQAREYVTRVSDSADSMVGRLDAIESELRELVDSLRNGGGRFRDELRALESDLAGLSHAVGPRPRFEPEEGAAPAIAEPGPEPELEPEPEPAATASAPESDDEPPAADSWQAPTAADDWHQSPRAEEPPLPEAAGLESVVDEPSAEQEPDWGEPERSYDFGALSSATSEPEYTYDPDNPEPLPEDGDEAEGARLIALNMALNGTPREETARYLSENFQLTDARGLLDEVYASVEG
ncbi:MAG: DivIVA domain-containing protein [Solirubrobacteraceae bacterium]